MIDRLISIMQVVASFLFVSVLLFACSPAEKLKTEMVDVIVEDGLLQTTMSIPVGMTVETILKNSNITLDALDRVSPTMQTVITNPTEILITRVKEEIFTIQEIIPFVQQSVRNESLPEGQSLLIQPGINGIQEVTYRRLIENGQLISETRIKVEAIQLTKPEILMIGVKTPFTPQKISGKLAYLTNGSAWVMEKTTGNRRPLVTTGDLDGRIFYLSPNGDWLLFSRNGNVDSLNSLWVVSVNDEVVFEIDLGVDNVIHYAEWDPQIPKTIYYSTVEPRTIAPGWQANNDLYRLTFSSSGKQPEVSELIETNAGGIYGWWGTIFSWSQDGKHLSYARPDSIGLVDLEEKSFNPLIEFVPYQTGSDWAWIPPLSWSPTQDVIYTLVHASTTALDSPEISPNFNLIALNLENKQYFVIDTQSGMFSYPELSINEVSPPRLAFLEAIYPEQSDTSRYRLILADVDGSNRKILFPDEGLLGIEPQNICWSPITNQNITEYIAFIYQGNAWLLNVLSLETIQITGDGLITKLDWK